MLIDYKMYVKVHVAAAAVWCYRDIQDKYRLSLTREARKQIQQAAHDHGLSHNVFIRTQYDVLRRLRTYWVNRFLIHKERMDELRYSIIAVISEIVRFILMTSVVTCKSDGCIIYFFFFFVINVQLT